MRTIWSRRILRSATTLVIVGVAALAATPASAADDGFVRLAHLSPDTPPVDVYLSSQSGAVPARTFPGVGYGVVSDYLRLPAGDYAVAMRPAGAPAAQPPVLTTQVTVAAGAAYTVAGVGRNADLGLRVITDDLRLPPPGAARVRVVQASVRAPVLTVTASGGPTLGDNVAFASTTGYRQVPAGRWTLRLQPAADGAATAVPVTLTDGIVYSLFILDGTAGLTAELRTDAGRRGTVPAGGVAAGGGGRDGARAAAVPLGALTVTLLVVAVGLLTARNRRRLPAR